MTSICLECKITETPQWRSGPFGSNTLCNKCGIKYMKNKNKKSYLKFKNKRKRYIPYNSSR